MCYRSERRKVHICFIIHVKVILNTEISMKKKSLPWFCNYSDLDINMQICSTSLQLKLQCIEYYNTCIKAGKSFGTLLYYANRTLKTFIDQLFAC